jgi:hypothetical protein
MSWQDELQQLDSALASGQISADEYRTRRDRVIAQASGQSVQEPQAPQQQAGGEPTHVFRPVQPISQPLPQQAAPQQQGGDQADRTQIVTGSQGQQVGDRTQVVGGNRDADSTQIVPGQKVQHPHFPPPPPPPPWETQHPQQPLAMSPPPWANEDLPPEFGQQSWPRQGPEVFEEKSGGGAGKIVAIIVAVVLVLGGAGAAIWFFALKDKGDDQAGGQTTQEQPKETTTPKPPPPDIPEGPFVDLPGDKVLNRTVPMQQSLTEKRPTEKEAQLLQSVGVAEVGALVTDEDGLRRGIWAFKAGEGGDPQAVLTAMDQFYKAANYELISEENGVLVRKLAAPTPDKPTVYRAHYVTEDGYMVRVEVYGTDSANVESTFNDLLAEETDKFAPVGP